MRSSRRAIGIASIGACLLASLPSGAVNTVYEYDELGRLISVTRPDSTVTSYTLDPAGNRTQVAELLGQATPPASISVPSSSSTGSYSVTWTAGTGPVTTYELWESTNASFSPQMRVFTGAGTSASISGHGNGTFYYRVRGCNGSACTAYRTGSNGVVVALPPGVPASLSTPATNTTGNISVSWGAASGNVTAYQLYEANNSGFTGAALVYNATGTNTTLPNRVNGTYYYRLRACNNGVCSGYTATVSTVVTIPVPPPTGLGYTQNSQCSFRATWTASAGATSYTVRDWSGNFQFSVSSSPATYDFCNAPGYTGNPTDYRPKWVKACNGSACSSQVNFP
jgi:YD repeat-containing protein